MTYVLGALILPLLLVFGLYHLLTWLNFYHINSLLYWRRVALVSAIAHVLLVSGFFIFSYADFTANRQILLLGENFGSFLFNRSEFWTLMLIFDPAPTALMLGLFALLDRMGLNPPRLLLVSMAIVYLVGTAQWYWIGGTIGVAFEKVWAGLKAGQDEED